MTAQFRIPAIPKKEDANTEIVLTLDSAYEQLMAADKQITKSSYGTPDELVKILSSKGIRIEHEGSSICRLLDKHDLIETIGDRVFIGIPEGKESEFLNVVGLYNQDLEKMAESCATQREVVRSAMAECIDSAVTQLGVTPLRKVRTPDDASYRMYWKGNLYEGKVTIPDKVIIPASAIDSIPKESGNVLVLTTPFNIIPAIPLINAYMKKHIDSLVAYASAMEMPKTEGMASRAIRYLRQRFA